MMLKRLRTFQGVCKQTIFKYQRRDVRIMSLDAQQQINMIPNTVSFKFIDSNGATKRFYRQVFIESLHVPHVTKQKVIGVDDADYTPRTPSTPHNFYQESVHSQLSYLIKLDDRHLILQGGPILIDHYDLALMVMSEFEMQGEYIRLESMPLTEIITNLIERDLRINAVPMDMRRMGYSQSVLSMIETDLILIAENDRQLRIGYYEKHWVPIIDWFNETFATKLELEYMIMHGEKDNINEFEAAMDVQNMFDMDPDDVMDKYQSTEIAQKVESMQQSLKEKKEKNEKKNINEFKKVKQFLASLDDTRMSILDDMIQYCYSPMIAIGLLLNAISMEQILKAIECSELDVSMIVPNEEHLKLNQSMLKLAACRTFLDVYDKMYPLPENKVVMTYKNPVVV